MLDAARELGGIRTKSFADGRPFRARRAGESDARYWNLARAAGAD